MGVTKENRKSIAELFIENDNNLKQLLKFLVMDRDPDQLARAFGVTEDAMLRILKGANIEPKRNKSISPSMISLINSTMEGILENDVYDYNEALYELRNQFMEDTGVDLFEATNAVIVDNQTAANAADEENRFLMECAYGATLALAYTKPILTAPSGNIYLVIPLEKTMIPSITEWITYEADNASFNFDDISEDIAILFEKLINDNTSGGAKRINIDCFLFGSVKIMQFPSLIAFNEAQEKVGASSTEEYLNKIAQYDEQVSMEYDFEMEDMYEALESFNTLFDIIHKSAPEVDTVKHKNRYDELEQRLNDIFDIEVPEAVDYIIGLQPIRLSKRSYVPMFWNLDKLKERIQSVEAKETSQEDILGKAPTFDEYERYDAEPLYMNQEEEPVVLMQLTPFENIYDVVSGGYKIANMEDDQNKETLPVYYLKSGDYTDCLATERDKVLQQWFIDYYELENELDKMAEPYEEEYYK